MQKRPIQKQPMQKNLKLAQKIIVYGKWILAGEYAVLRYHPALVLPLKSCFVKLCFKKLTEKNKSYNQLILTSNNKHHEVIFASILKKAFKKCGFSYPPSYALYMESHIDFGLGLGASAVLCAIAGRFLQAIGGVEKPHLFTFCHSLEHTLHGKSSGVDIAGVVTKKPLLYQKIKTKKPLIKTIKPCFKPCIYLSLPAQRKSQAGVQQSTQNNIRKIQGFWKNYPLLAQTLDAQMAQAVLKAKKALVQKRLTKKARLSYLTQAFNLAEGCFLKWGLMSKSMRQHSVLLKKQGALATKPTGSGGNGYVLSLWNKPPPAGVLTNNNSFIPT